jgi:hypothetical protein
MHTPEKIKPQACAFAQACGSIFPSTSMIQVREGIGLAHLADFHSRSEQHQNRCHSDASNLTAPALKRKR